ncbi:hypothetical protein UFOVP45_79 [uncultured Caudovirales phage]|uniref:Uncharacterized protein n=1 Tax=uncultured Caudovirales phage TaxID=2100421 RepID=A0A6J5KS45_9CAUD|nr:hypothetical protein UFOVP45_79 [uncultured Caudovirales phage]
MAKWTSLGHGMRRRIGAPSNHLESAGKSMSRNNPTSDEAYASQGNGARATLGAVGSSAPVLTGSLVPKKNVQAGDPTIMDKANRVNIEKLGATYRVNAKYSATIDPAAGATMANARIIPSVAGRANPNFESGIQTSSL